MVSTAANTVHSKKFIFKKLMVILLSFLICAVGGLLVTKSIMNYVSLKLFITSAEHTVADIVSVEHLDYLNGHLFADYDIIIKYNVGDQTRHNTITHTVSATDDDMLKDTIEIYYDKEDPSIVKTISSYQTITNVFKLVIGVLFIIIGIEMTLHFKELRGNDNDV